MRFLKVSLVLLAGISSLVAAAPTLAALPDVHLLSGEEYPVLGEGSVSGTFQGEVVGKLETEIGEKLTFTKLSLSLELLELSSLGPDSLVLTGVLEAKKKVSCHSEGAAEGEVKIAGEYHVVETSLGHALLILFKELSVLCNSGKLKVKVRAPWMGELNVSSGTDVTLLGLNVKCFLKGSQNVREYLNDEERLVKGQLTANFGLGFETACLELTNELTMFFTKMVDFLF